MKYEYKFRTGSESVEVDEDWAQVLKELDRSENSNDWRSRYHTVHYNAFEFEPGFMGKEEQEITAMFDGSPAYEYARKRISARNMEIIRRRILNGESFPQIAKSYRMSDNGVGCAFRSNLKRFCKYYEDGVWINSSENKDYPGIGRVLSIPYKLTPEQVIAIRIYRWQCYSLNDIAKLVGVNGNQVLICLSENPVMQSVCPSCGKEIHQAYRKKMRVFCSRDCYMAWYGGSCNIRQKLHPLKARRYLNRYQELVVQYYKQYRISHKRMREITGLPLRTITAYFNTNPLPYTVCMSCGKKITELAQRNHIKAFCSQKCFDHYHNMEFYYRQYKGIEFYPKPTIPPPECLFLAITMNDMEYTRSEIASCTGMSETELESLFRFDKADDQEDTENMRMINKIVTGSVRIVNAHVWEPAELTGTSPLYTATLLISKDDEKTLAGIRAALEDTIQNGLKKEGIFATRKHIELPLHNGDINPPDPIFHNCYYINASCVDAPQIVDHQVIPITYKESFASGCLARVSLTFYPYWINQKRYGIGCQLGNLQKVYTWEQFTPLPDVAFADFEEEYARLFYKRT